MNNLRCPFCNHALIEQKCVSCKYYSDYGIESYQVDIRDNSYKVFIDQYHNQYICSIYYWLSGATQGVKIYHSINDTITYPITPNMSQEAIDKRIALLKIWM